MTYHRTAPSEWASSTNNKREVSENYWRKQARTVFASHSAIETVEIVFTGRKTDSKFIKRGKQTAPEGVCVILASTGGSWGRSRREFLPLVLSKGGAL
jgi:hypothetical protein